MMPLIMLGGGRFRYISKTKPQRLIFLLKNSQGWAKTDFFHEKINVVVLARRCNETQSSHRPDTEPQHYAGFFENFSVGPRFGAISAEIGTKTGEKVGNGYAKRGHKICCPPNLICVLMQKSM